MIFLYCIHYSPRLETGVVQCDSLVLDSAANLLRLYTLPYIPIPYPPHIPQALSGCVRDAGVGEAWDEKALERPLWELHPLDVSRSQSEASTATDFVRGATLTFDSNFSQILTWKWRTGHSWCEIILIRLWHICRSFNSKMAWNDYGNI